MSVPPLGVGMGRESLWEVEPAGALAEVADLRLQALSLKLTRYRVPIHIVFISSRLKEIQCSYSSLTPLQVAKDQVDPFVQAVRYNIALKSLPGFQDEPIAFGPLREPYIPYLFFQVV